MNAANTFQTRSDSGKDVFDVAVIGGGVVGCAALRAVATRGLSAVLLEAEADLLEGASKANSAILHTGFDAPSGSIEHGMVRRGHALYRRIHERAGLPLLETGAVLVAWTEADVGQLPNLAAKAHANGVGDVRVIDRSELLRREPNLSDRARGALLVPGESVIDPWSAPLAYALQATRHGARILRGCRVTGGRRVGGEWRLDTSLGAIAAKVTVNCAGLSGDRVEAIARAPDFEIRPRKGQFLVFEKRAHDLVGAIVLKVPTERTKGVLLTRTAFGNLLLGPTAEEQQDRHRAPTDRAVLAELRLEGEAMLPALADCVITACYAGLRPGTQHQDYQLRADEALGWITVGGARSTGLTASLALGEYVAEAAGSMLGGSRLDPDDQSLDWPQMPNLAESRHRPHQGADRSDIVCHCELVTEREVTEACNGPIPAGTLGGLKRRTRAMMGACQGFGCAGRVLEIASLQQTAPAGARL